MGIVSYEELQKSITASNDNLSFIRENIDIIYRMILSENLVNGRIAQIKVKYGSIFYLEYQFIKNIINKLTLSVKLNEIHDFRADVLVFFTPYRKDMEDFIYPVINELVETGLIVSVIIPKIGIKSGISASPQAKFLLYEGFVGNITYYIKARCNYNNIARDLWKWMDANRISDIKKSKLAIFFQKYALDSLIASSILELVKPKVVYSLHYILSPGYLQAIRSYQQQDAVNNILIQHGFFLPNYYGFHDFKGADTAILWGDYHKKVLEQMIDIPKNVKIIGNPKLEISLKELNSLYTLKPKKEKMTLYIAGPSPKRSRRDRKSFETFLDAIKKIEGIDVKIKLRPGDTLKDYREYINNGYLVKEQFIQNQDIFQTLLSADIITGRFSTSMFEAMAMCKPVIPISTSQGDFDWSELGLESVSDSNELAMRIKHLLEQPESAENLIEKQNSIIKMVFGDYMNASRKIANYISSLVQAK